MLGLRRSEASELRVGDLELLEDRWLITVKGKGDRDRKLPIPKVLAATWSQWFRRINEEAPFTWDLDEGYSHHRVDDGEELPAMKQTAILISNGTVNASVLTALLHGSRNGIEPRLYEFVSAKVLEYEND